MILYYIISYHIIISSLYFYCINYYYSINSFKRFTKECFTTQTSIHIELERCWAVKKLTRAREPLQSVQDPCPSVRPSDKNYNQLCEVGAIGRVSSRVISAGFHEISIGRERTEVLIRKYNVRQAGKARRRDEDGI